MQAPPSYSEVVPPQASAGANDASAYIPLDSPFIKEEDVDLMMSMSMGWPKSFCQVALIRCSGNINEAMNMLMENNEAVMSQFVREYKANQMLLAERANGGRGRQSRTSYPPEGPRPTPIPVQRANKRWSIMNLFGNSKEKEASSINLTNGAVNTSPSRADEPFVQDDVENYFSSAMDENASKMMGKNIEIIQVDDPPPPAYDDAPPLYDEIIISHSETQPPSFDFSTQNQPPADSTSSSNSTLQFDSLLAPYQQNLQSSDNISNSILLPESEAVESPALAATQSLVLGADGSGALILDSPPQSAKLRPKKPPRSSMLSRESSAFELIDDQSPAAASTFASAVSIAAPADDHIHSQPESLHSTQIDSNGFSTTPFGEDAHSGDGFSLSPAYVSDNSFAVSNQVPNVATADPFASSNTNIESTISSAHDAKDEDEDFGVSSKNLLDDFSDSVEITTTTASAVSDPVEDNQAFSSGHVASSDVHSSNEVNNAADASVFSEDSNATLSSTVPTNAVEAPADSQNQGKSDASVDSSDESSAVDGTEDTQSSNSSLKASPNRANITERLLARKANIHNSKMNDVSAVTTEDDAIDNSTLAPASATATVVADDSVTMPAPAAQASASVSVPSDASSTTTTIQTVAQPEPIINNQPPVSTPTTASTPHMEDSNIPTSPVTPASHVMADTSAASSPAPQNSNSSSVSLSVTPNTNSGKKSSDFEIDDLVEANFRNRGKWFKGRIMMIHQDGTYDVQYEDKTKGYRLQRESIRFRDGWTRPISSSASISPSPSNGDLSSVATSKTHSPALSRVSSTPDLNEGSHSTSKPVDTHSHDTGSNLAAIATTAAAAVTVAATVATAGAAAVVAGAAVGAAATLTSAASVAAASVSTTAAAVSAAAHVAADVASASTVASSALATADSHANVLEEVVSAGASNMSAPSAVTSVPFTPSVVSEAPKPAAHSVSDVNTTRPVETESKIPTVPAVETKPEIKPATVENKSSSTASSSSGSSTSASSSSSTAVKAPAVAASTTKPPAPKVVIPKAKPVSSLYVYSDLLNNKNDTHVYPLLADVLLPMGIHGEKNYSCKPVENSYSKFDVDHMNNPSLVVENSELYLSVAAPLPMTQEEIQKREFEKISRQDRRRQKREERARRERSWTFSIEKNFWGEFHVEDEPIDSDEEAQAENREGSAAAGGQEISRFKRRVQLPYKLKEIPPENGSDTTYAGMLLLKQPKVPSLDKSPQGDRPDVVTTRSCPTRLHVVRMCESYSPPTWAGPEDPQMCIICSHTFAVFRPGHHCRNCGYWVCEHCSSKCWPSTMVPDTFHDNKKVVRVCDSCAYLAEAFADALRSGDMDRAIAIYETGNVNLRQPYDIYITGEYPVHSAAQGGNLELLKWLLEDRLCPITNELGEKPQPLTTKSGLTVFAVAAKYGRKEIMSYLVQHGCNVNEITDIHVLINGLHAALDAPGVLPVDNGPRNSGLFSSSVEDTERVVVSRDTSILSSGTNSSDLADSETIDSLTANIDSLPKARYITGHPRVGSLLHAGAAVILHPHNDTAGGDHSSVSGPSVVVVERPMWKNRYRNKFDNHLKLEQSKNGPAAGFKLAVAIAETAIQKELNARRASKENAIAAFSSMTSICSTTDSHIKSHEKASALDLTSPIMSFPSAHPYKEADVMSFERDAYYRALSNIRDPIVDRTVTAPTSPMNPNSNSNSSSSSSRSNNQFNAPRPASRTGFGRTSGAGSSASSASASAQSQDDSSWASALLQAAPQAPQTPVARQNARTAVHS